MANLARFVSALWDLDTYYVFEDFSAEIGTSGDLTWKDFGTGTGTFAVSDAANGILAIANSAAANDEGYVALTNETFLVAANRQMYGRARVQFTEANTNDAAVFFGFANAVAADLIVDGATGMKTTGNWIGFFKVLDETLWRVGCRNSTDVNNTQSGVTAGGADYQVLEVEVHDAGGTNVTVNYKINGNYLRDSNGFVIRHTLPVASSTEMQLVAGIKNGAGNAETLNIDYLFGCQNRDGSQDAHV